ncbi:hypothetical protein BV903_015695 [Lysobacter enzymogenes]|nr:hypothetical protein [Lysobacter enzymogenes]UZW58754.1 hypothetical protein BV903_015695 [Lysobacter enzymogenes]
MNGLNLKRDWMAPRLGACAVWALIVFAASPAQAQLKVSSTFRNNTEPGWTLSGTAQNPNNPSGILTGGRGNIPSSANNNTGTNDPNGSGWLRLTTESQGQRGLALYTAGNTFDSDLGVIAEFDYVSWGGLGNADGLTMFLYDATKNMGGARPGGSLGYCGGDGGYLGVGLDEFGNFSNQGDLGTGYCSTNNGSGFQPGRVVVRGPTVGGAGGTNVLVGNAPVANLSTPGLRIARPSSRRVRMSLLPNGVGGYRVTVQLGPAGGGALTTYLNGLNYNFPAPATLRMGFAGSTGGSTNFHEIRNAVAAAPADIAVTKTVAAQAVLRGQPATYTVTVHNNDVNPTDPGDQSPPIDSANAPDIADVFPTQLTDVTWTCAATAGSSCPAASGAGSLAIAGGYNLASGGTLTFTVTGTVAPTAACGSTVNNTASADFSATDGFSDINTANNSASASFTVQCPTLVVRKTSQEASAPSTSAATTASRPTASPPRPLERRSTAPPRRCCPQARRPRSPKRRRPPPSYLRASRAPAWEPMAPRRRTWPTIESCWTQPRPSPPGRSRARSPTPRKHS